MSLEWQKCCKGRKCPEVALEGALVHIKDDYGNQVTVDRGNVPFFQEPDDLPPDPIDLNDQTLRIHGKEKGKPPVRMSLLQFYQLLEHIDNPSQPVSEDEVVKEKFSTATAAAAAEVSTEAKVEAKSPEKKVQKKTKKKTRKKARKKTKAK